MYRDKLLSNGTSKGKPEHSISAVVVVFFVCFSFRDSSGNTMSDDERSRAIHGGHRGVVTKLVREAEEITNKADPLDSTQRIRLSVIKQQLDVKLNLLNDMDKEILTRCELDAIVNELEESEAVTAKIISCKQKIEEKLTVVTPATSTPVSPMLHASLPPLLLLPWQNLDCLDCNFPDLGVMSRIGQHSGTLSNRLSMRIQNYRRWISLIT